MQTILLWKVKKKFLLNLIITAIEEIISKSIVGSQNIKAGRNQTFGSDMETIQAGENVTVNPRLIPRNEYVFFFSRFLNLKAFLEKNSGACVTSCAARG